MTDGAAGNAVESAIATARVRAFRTGLLDLHKTLLDIERVRFERLHGRFENAADQAPGGSREFVRL